MWGGGFRHLFFFVSLVLCHLRVEEVWDWSFSGVRGCLQEGSRLELQTLLSNPKTLSPKHTNPRPKAQLYLAGS